MKTLRRELNDDKIAYVFLGAELGGRPSSERLYCDGVADYEKMAETPQFVHGIDRILKGSEKFRIALMCSEHNPLDCHRCLLVGRALKHRGVQVTHILFNGHCKSQDAIEEELVSGLKQNAADLFPSDQIATAYRDRSMKVAYAKEPRASLPDDAEEIF